MWRAIVALGLLGVTNAYAAIVEARLPNGVWASKTYGYVFAVEGQSTQIFDVSSAGCVAGDRMTIDAATALWGNAEMASDARSATLTRFPTKDALTKLASLPDACAKPLKTDDPTVNLDVFLKTLDAHYPFFKARNVDWPRLSDVARQRVRAGDELFSVLVDIIRVVNDGHVSLEAGEREFQIDPIVAPGKAPDGSQWTWKTLRGDLRAKVQDEKTFLSAPATLSANNRVLVGQTKDGYGYIAVLAMGGWAQGQTEETPAADHTASADAEMEKILSSIGSVKGMIVDLRVNSGGFDAVALALAGRFTQTTERAYRKSAKGPDGLSPAYDVSAEPRKGARFNGPVAVLIGPNTVSAGETAALAFKSLPNARLFGAPTRGILSDAIPKRLPNGWNYTLSMEVTTLPDGTLVEVAGVKPDTIVVSGDRIDWSAEVDAARKWLAERLR